jgi:hypothetical protein
MASINSNILAVMALLVCLMAPGALAAGEDKGLLLSALLSSTAGTNTCISSAK